MTIWWLSAILVAVGAVGVGFIWLLIRLERLSHNGNVKQQVLEASNTDVEHIFNDEFREELRNRGRLHFEKIIAENAMFLQQDLRLTTSELNEYMKQELSSKLREEFSKYEESITDAKQLAIESIEKTKQTIEEERQLLGQKLSEEVEAEKERMLKRFAENTGDIVNHYVLASIGEQIDLSDQLEFILSDLEANKDNILEDIKHGA